MELIKLGSVLGFSIVFIGYDRYVPELLINKTFQRYNYKKNLVIES